MGTIAIHVHVLPIHVHVLPSYYKPNMEDIDESIENCHTKRVLKCFLIELIIYKPNIEGYNHNAVPVHVYPQ